ncbi:MAG: LytR C-terminal domain-containing protein [Aeromicrobium sp.]
MTRRNLTLIGSAVVFVIGLFAGFQMLIAKPAEPPPPPTCEDKTIAAGGKLTTNLVTVNVFNASSRSGLANRVNINLQRNGFLGGEIGNDVSAAKPAPVTILTNDQNDPRVKLVAAQFKNKVAYAVPDIAVKEGVVIVIGDNFTNLKSEPPHSIVASTDVTTCVPIVALP